MNEIWLIMVMDSHYFKFLQGEAANGKSYSRVVGLLDSETEAVDVVKANVNQISEGGSNRYAVVYPLAKGLWCGCKDFLRERWFEYDDSVDAFYEIKTSGRKLVMLGI